MHINVEIELIFKARLFYRNLRNETAEVLPIILFMSLKSCL